MTLKQIAQMAGVSITTVSCVLNDKSSKVAGKEVKDKIWKIACDNGYSPNSAARALRKPSKVDEEPEMKFLYCLCARPYAESREDTFYDQIIAGISQAAYKNNYILKHRFELHDLDNGTLEAILADCNKENLITMGRLEPELLQRVSKYFQNIVSVSLNKLDVEYNHAYDQILCDGYLACQKVMTYLYGLQHREIGFIGQRCDARYKGYINSLERLGLPVKQELIIDNVVLTMNGGSMAMNELLERKTGMTAVFCTSDRTAIGALSACNNRGIHVPQDMSIIGMNDIEASKFVAPALTTIHVPLEEMGAIAVQTLINRVNNMHSLPLQICVPFYMEERSSCAYCK